MLFTITLVGSQTSAGHGHVVCLGLPHPNPGFSGLQIFLCPKGTAEWEVVCEPGQFASGRKTMQTGLMMRELFQSLGALQHTSKHWLSLWSWARELVGALEWLRSNSLTRMEN